MLPVGLVATTGVSGCRLAVIGPDDCAAAWRGWIFGSSETSSQHLVMQAAPRVVRDPARAIDGPGWAPGDRVQPRGLVRVGGKTLHWYYVPPALNDGSAFAHHLVLVWAASGHTYAYGFHVVDTFAEARALDLELMRHLVIARPPVNR